MWTKILSAALVACAVACSSDSDNKQAAGGTGGAGAEGGSGGEGASFEVWEDDASKLLWTNPSQTLLAWQEAIDFCKDASIGDHDDWRLPDIGELRTLIRGCANTVHDSDCDIADGTGNDHLETECLGCEKSDGPADGCYWPDSLEGDCIYTWSSSTHGDDTDMAWSVLFVEGTLVPFDKGLTFEARCVRDPD